jgi:hypothetical protein
MESEGKISGKIKCAKCKTEVIIPSLTQEQKLGIIKAYQHSGDVFAIEMIRNLTRFALHEAKALYLHLNDNKHCNRCAYDSLVGENVVCPKCKAFNLNWNGASLVVH